MLLASGLIGKESTKTDLLSTKVALVALKVCSRFVIEPLEELLNVDKDSLERREILPLERLPPLPLTAGDGVPDARRELLDDTGHDGLNNRPGFAHEALGLPVVAFRNE